jgi:hypothetical protein
MPSKYLTVCCGDDSLWILQQEKIVASFRPDGTAMKIFQLPIYPESIHLDDSGLLMVALRENGIDIFDVRQTNQSLLTLHITKPLSAAITCRGELAVGYRTNAKPSQIHSSSHVNIYK